MSTLQIQAHTGADGCRVALKGWIDSSNSHELESWLDENLDQVSGQLVFCCKDLQFISSAGVRVFLHTVRRVASLPDCHLSFAGVGASVRSVFEMTGLVKLVELVEE